MTNLKSRSTFMVAVVALAASCSGPYLYVTKLDDAGERDLAFAEDGYQYLFNGALRNESTIADDHVLEGERFLGINGVGALVVFGARPVADIAPCGVRVRPVPPGVGIGAISESPEERDRDLCRRARLCGVAPDSRWADRLVPSWLLVGDFVDTGQRLIQYRFFSYRILSGYDPDWVETAVAQPDASAMCIHPATGRGGGPPGSGLLTVAATVRSPDSEIVIRQYRGGDPHLPFGAGGRAAVSLPDGFEMHTSTEVVYGGSFWSALAIGTIVLPSREQHTIYVVRVRVGGDVARGFGVLGVAPVTTVESIDLSNIRLTAWNEDGVLVWMEGQQTIFALDGDGNLDAGFANLGVLDFGATDVLGGEGSFLDLSAVIVKVDVSQSGQIYVWRRTPASDMVTRLTVRGQADVGFAGNGTAILNAPPGASDHEWEDMVVGSGLNPAVYLLGSGDLRRSPS